LRGGYAGILVVFWGGFFEKNGQYQFNNQEQAHHQRFTFSGYFSVGTESFKIVFNRLTSALTEVLSKLAIKMNRIYLEYPYHIIAFFDLLETPWAGENGFLS